MAAALSSFWFGSLVDNHRKKTVMMISSLVTLLLFSAGLWLFLNNPESVFASVSSPLLWLLVVLLLGGVITGGIYNIAVPTLVTVLVPKATRDRANGLLGTVMGLSFAATSVASGIILGFGGMFWVLSLAIIFTVISMVHLALIKIPENEVMATKVKGKEKPKPNSKQKNGLDIRGTIKTIASIPGLFALIFFTTFNNFIGGVFMALMDAYGLTMVSVQIWGLIWGGLSFGFIFGGLYIAKYGLGRNPLKTLFRVNLIIWFTCMLFPLQHSIVLLILGSLVWMMLNPFIEATEQTIIQAVVPQRRQGRVFGFAHSIEQAAAPLTAFMIGPIAQFFFIPLMTDGWGATAIGSWFGTGIGRGIALVFMMAGALGLVVTLIAMRSPSYKLLNQRYNS